MKDATRISRSKKVTQMRVNSKRERERGNRRRERERGISTISILRTLKLAHWQALCAFYYNALN